MPSNGQHSFLLSYAKKVVMKYARVNALKRATLISTENAKDINRMAKGVNALKRATLISTKEALTIESVLNVSMPSNGQHSFLHVGKH